MAIKREEKTEPVKTSFIDLEKADRGFVELMLWLDDKGYDFNERVFLLDQAKTFTINLGILWYYSFIK